MRFEFNRFLVFLTFIFTFMSKQIKLIWEFRGPNALQTAKHHLIHLKEYMVNESLDFESMEFESQSYFICNAYLITNVDYLQQLRTDLKPNRGQYYTPES